LNRDALLVMRREESLEQQQLNGSLTSYLVLNDIREGDIVDYAFTVRGANPIMNGHYARAFMLSWGVPVSFERVRLIYPSDKKLRYRFSEYSSTVTPSVLQRGRQMDWSLVLKDIPAIHHEGNTPSWYTPYAWVEFSDFDDWEEVQRWAREIYKAPSLGQDLLRKAGDWTSAYSNVEDRALAAIRFVQDEVRYLGVESGIFAYQPSAPDKVYARRYGDCKDKTFLLNSLLRALNVTSYPVLVNSYFRDRIHQWLPSHRAFDHVILAYDVGGGVKLIDATACLQGGSCAEMAVANYRVGLPLNDAAFSLCRLTEPSEEMVGEVSVQETYRSEVFGEDVDLKVRSVYTGSSADQIRRQMAASGMGKFKQDYMKYYVPQYPQIRVVDPVVCNDNRQQNRLTIDEHYAITNFWRDEPKTGRWYADIQGRLIGDMLELPSVATRNMPLRIPHPSRLSLQSDFFLPCPWPMQDDIGTISTKASRLSYAITHTGQFVRCAYDYATTRDFISPDEMPEYIRQTSEMKDFLYLRFTSPVGQLPFWEELNWMYVLWSLMALAMAGSAAIVLWKKQNSLLPPLPPALPDQVQGIAGWLVVVCLLVCLKPLIIVAQSVSSMTYMRLSVWHALTAPGSESYHALWAPLLLVEDSIVIACFVFSLLSIPLFFSKKRMFPRLFVAIFVVGVLWGIISSALLKYMEVPEDNPLRPRMAQAIGQALGSMIWILYVTVSVRVKNTFRR